MAGGGVRVRSSLFIPCGSSYYLGAVLHGRPRVGVVGGIPRSGPFEQKASNCVCVCVWALARLTASGHESLLDLAAPTGEEKGAPRVLCANSDCTQAIKVDWTVPSFRPVELAKPESLAKPCWSTTVCSLSAYTAGEWGVDVRHRSR